MADRSVSVFLKANVTGYLASVEKAKLATRDLARDAEKSAAKHGQAWDRVGKGMLLTGGVIAAGIGLAVKAAMEFDAQMAQIKSLSGATSSEMKKLSDAAKTVGRDFGISAKEAADAETELVKAGISVTDILGGGLKGALTLAADGQMNVADATSIAASAMVQFGLSGKDVPHIADLLAAGADKALGSVGDLGQALTSSGTVAAQWGLTMEQTVGTLAEFAAAGQTGERGGTLLRQMLLQLTTASGPAKALMDKYGFSVETAGGNLADTSTIAARLQASFGGLDAATRTHALGVIFGAHAIQGANILLKDGAAVNADWAKKVNDSGFAAKQAAGKMDSLQGDLQKLQASFQTALIDTGEQATGSLRHLTKGATGLINAFDDLSPFAKTMIVDLGGVVAVTALVGGAALIAIPKVVAFKAALAELGLTAKTTAASLGLEAGAEGAAGRGGLGKGAKAIGGATLFTAVGLSAIDAVQAKGQSDLKNEAQGWSPAQLAAAQAQVASLTAVRAQGGPNAARTSDRLANLKDQVALATEAMKANAAAAPAAATGIKKIGSAAGTSQLSVADFDTAIKKLSARFDIRTQTDALTAGFHNLAKQAKESGTAVKGNSDAALANRTALTQQYQAALGIIQTYRDQGHSAADVKEKTKEVTKQFVDQAGKAGFVKTKIDKYVTALGQVPANKNTKVTLDTSGAAAKLRALKAGFSTLDFYAHQKDAGATGGLMTGHGFVRRSAGGPVWGAGTATSDSIPALLSNGEYVIKASSVKAIGVQNLHALNRYASGGAAGGSPVMASSGATVTQYITTSDPLRAAGLSAARLAWAAR